MANLVADGNIPQQLVYQLDHTGLPLCVTSRHTYMESGVREVKIATANDKRQITGVPVINAAGEFIFMQLIFTGKTDRVIILKI